MTENVRATSLGGSSLPTFQFDDEALECYGKRTGKFIGEVEPNKHYDGFARYSDYCSYGSQDVTGRVTNRFTTFRDKDDQAEFFIEPDKQFEKTFRFNSDQPPKPPESVKKTHVQPNAGCVHETEMILGPISEQVKELSQTQNASKKKQNLKEQKFSSRRPFINDICESLSSIKQRKTPQSTVRKSDFTIYRDLLTEIEDHREYAIRDEPEESLNRDYQKTEKSEGHSEAIKEKERKKENIQAGKDCLMQRDKGRKSEQTEWKQNKRVTISDGDQLFLPTDTVQSSQIEKDLGSQINQVVEWKGQKPEQNEDHRKNQKEKMGLGNKKVKQEEKASKEQKKKTTRKKKNVNKNVKSKSKKKSQTKYVNKKQDESVFHQVSRLNLQPRKIKINQAQKQQHQYHTNRVQRYLPNNYRFEMLQMPAEQSQQFMRGKRRHIKPLEFWKSEKVIYQRGNIVAVQRLKDVHDLVGLPNTVQINLRSCTTPILIKFGFCIPGKQTISCTGFSKQFKSLQLKCLNIALISYGLSIVNQFQEINFSSETMVTILPDRTFEINNRSSRKATIYGELTK